MVQRLALTLDELLNDWAMCNEHIEGYERGTYRVARDGLN
jgi:hypothetical protein